jgi:hypothetical protein
MYDKKVASFTDLPLSVDAHAAPDPPHNCAICARQGEEEVQVQGGSYTELGRLLALWSTGRHSTWGTLRSCVQSKAPLALRSSLVCILVIRSRLGCSYLSECRISRTCYCPKSSGTSYILFYAVCRTAFFSHIFLSSQPVLHRRCTTRRHACSVLCPTLGSRLLHGFMDRTWPRLLLLQVPVSGTFSCVMR